MWEARTGDGYERLSDRTGAVKSKKACSSTTLTFFLRQELLITFSKYGVDRLGRASVEAEPTTFHAARRVKFERWGRQPCARRADGDTDRLMRTTIGVAD